ncbi:MAG: helix-hairpin-helix domain-containing protein [Candidatus Pacearchaeota archaeon]|nr:helix-hairpin-helix domain-containing protein [Candidatus Pacearchaeota archaeon]
MKEIFNIFPKRSKKIKIIEKPVITADYREKNSLVIAELKSLGVDAEIKELKVADYLVKGIAIERKTISDFISSMKNQRLLKQLEELQQYENRILIIEGFDEQELYTDSEERVGMHPNAIRGFLLSILLNHKVPIIFTKNYEDTARFLSILSRKKPRESPLNISKKSLSVKERSQFILESFPGIGPKTAKKLLKKFGTIKNVINAPEEELKKELGKKSDVFIRIINNSFC